MIGTLTSPARTVARAPSIPAVNDDFVRLIHLLLSNLCRPATPISVMRVKPCPIARRVADILQRRTDARPSTD